MTKEMHNDRGMSYRFVEPGMIWLVVPPLGRDKSGPYGRGIDGTSPEGFVSFVSLVYELLTS